METRTQIFEWSDYWNRTQPELNAHLEQIKNPQVSEYLKNCLAMYFYVTDNWDEKVTKNKKISKQLSIFIVQIMDLLRGTYGCYEQFTLTPLSLLLRSAFEAKVNFLYITRSTDSERLADLFTRFQQVDKFYGLKDWKLLAGDEQEHLEKLFLDCPEWFKRDSITGQIGPKFKPAQIHWTGTVTNLREMAKATHVNLEEQYVKIYKTASKFSHPTSIVSNQYRKEGLLTPIPGREECDRLALLAASRCMYVLVEACDFFGVTFPIDDYIKILPEQLKSNQE